MRNDGLSHKEIKRAAIASRLTQLLYSIDGGSSGSSGSSNDNNTDNQNKGDHGNNRLFLELESYGVLLFSNGPFWLIIEIIWKI